VHPKIHAGLFKGIPAEIESFQAKPLTIQALSCRFALTFAVSALTFLRGNHELIRRNPARLIQGWVFAWRT
jgi:hypothetical protein